MSSTLNAEIRERLVRYLAGEISLAAFQEWLVPRAWDVEQSGNAAAIELANELELRLAEYTSGHRTEAELREALLPLVRTQHSVYGASVPTATSASVTTRSPVTWTSGAAGRGFAAAPA